MDAPQTKDILQASRSLPQPVSDGQEVKARGGKYGELYGLNLYNKAHGLAEEGSYFVTTNPTPGTGIATIATQASLADTAPFILVKNNQKAGGKRAILDFLKLICTAPGTAGTQVHVAVKVDDVNPLRYTSGSGGPGVGGLFSPQNVNMDDGTASQLLVYAGPVVAAAASGAARLLDHNIVRTAIPVIGDTVHISFAGNEGVISGAPMNGVVPSFFSTNFVPVVIGPQQWAAIHIWLPSQSAASSWEFALGHIER
jgi:hypothetical protein